MITPTMIVVLEDLQRQGLSISDIARRADLDRKIASMYLQRGLQRPMARGRRAHSG